MNREIVTVIELGFIGLTTLFFIILLAKLNRIIALLATPSTGYPAEAGPVAIHQANPLDCTAEEMAAIMAVLAKMIPNHQTAAVRIRVIK